MTNTTPQLANGNLAHADLTRQIIGAAIAVHKKLGPGFIESVYQNSLCIELDKWGLSFTKEQDVPVFYDDIEVGLHRLDLLVEDKIVVELKACRTIETRHIAVVRSYLRATDLNHGLVLNFSTAPLQIKRVIENTPI